MKFHSSAFTAAVVLGPRGVPLGAWAPLLGEAKHPNQWLHLSSTQKNPAYRSTSVVARHASVMAEGEANVVSLQTEETTAFQAEELMARGSIVSLFHGGLVAVRINEEDFDIIDNQGATPSAFSPTDIPNMKKKYSSDTGGDLVGHRVIFPNGERGVVVAHRPPIAFAYKGLDSTEVQDGHVSILKGKVNVPISKKRKLVGWDGRQIGPGDEYEVTKERAMFAPIPQVKDIALINNPMLTGNTMVDVLAPIGRGQNMLIVADDLAAVRGMICDFIWTQKQSRSSTKFVYAAIDNSDDVLEKLTAAGVVDDVHIVLSPRDDKNLQAEAAKAAEATAMAATACAIAESYALEQGMDAVVVVDTLDQHKQLWDATTRVLVDVFGAESVVKSDREGGASSEMRGFYSSIIQRAGQYKEKLGGGSLTLILICELPKLKGMDEDTAYLESDFDSGSDKVKTRIQLLVSKGIPLTAVNLRKIDIPIPSASEGKRRLVLQYIDDLISMSDGQLWFDATLREAGQYPPIDPQRSITRVGIGADTESRADAPALRCIAGGLRLALSQAANMEGAADTVASKKQVRTKDALLLAMHQVEGRGGRALSESCTLLLAASNGYFDVAVEEGKTAGTVAGQELIDDLLDHVQTVAPSAVAKINQSLDLPESTRQEVLDAIESFFSP